MYKITYKILIRTKSGARTVEGEYDTLSGIDSVMHYIRTLKTMGVIQEINIVESSKNS